MDFKELLDTFAQDVGMTEPVEYEDENLCHLDINGRDFGFLYAAETEQLVIWTVIMPRPVDSGEALLVQLLRANFMNQGMPDGALSLSEDDMICAHCTLKMPVYDKGEFYALLQRFVKAADEWRTMIELAERTKGFLKEVRPNKPDDTPTHAMRFDI